MPPNTNPNHLRDVTSLVEANTRLCEALTQSQSDLVERLDRVNSDDSRRMSESCSRLRGMVAALVILNAYQFYANDHDKAEILTSSVVAGQVASEAKSLAYLSEATAEQFREDQTQFNETVLRALEEIKKKWTQSRTTTKR